MGDPVMLTAVESGGERFALMTGRRLGERAVGEKLGDVVETGEPERAKDESRKGGGMVKGSMVRRERSTSCSWWRRRYFVRAEDCGS